MPTNELTHQDCIDLMSVRDPLGVDAKGRTHYHDHLTQTAWVTVDDEIAHIEPDASFNAWIDYTAERVGWEWHARDDRSIGTLLAQTLITAQGAV